MRVQVPPPDRVLRTSSAARLRSRRVPAILNRLAAWKDIIPPRSRQVDFGGEAWASMPNPAIPIMTFRFLAPAGVRPRRAGAPVGIAGPPRGHAPDIPASVRRGRSNGRRSPPRPSPLVERSPTPRGSERRGSPRPWRRSRGRRTAGPGPGPRPTRPTASSWNRCTPGRPRGVRASRAPAPRNAGRR